MAYKTPIDHVLIELRAAIKAANEAARWLRIDGEEEIADYVRDSAKPMKKVYDKILGHEL